jgi:hypothetical protein
MEHVDAMTESFPYQLPSETEKYWYRLQGLHGCGSLCQKMKKRIEMRLKGYDEQSSEATESKEIFSVEMEGPDPEVSARPKEQSRKRASSLDGGTSNPSNKT